uniref:Uncharacterized protein n=1 Tax=Vespula pensylvanica TaxID=30213 RepID=A0A834NC09_VESPE|nr:hypothetical protein H0235_015234 [Vespula pensylvanica]
MPIDRPDSPTTPPPSPPPPLPPPPSPTSRREKTKRKEAPLTNDEDDDDDDDDQVAKYLSHVLLESDTAGRTYEFGTLQVQLAAGHQFGNP